MLSLLPLTIGISIKFNGKVKISYFEVKNRRDHITCNVLKCNPYNVTQAPSWSNQNLSPQLKSNSFPHHLITNGTPQFFFSSPPCSLYPPLFVNLFSLHLMQPPIYLQVSSQTSRQNIPKATKFASISSFHLSFLQGSSSFLFHQSNNDSTVSKV